MSDTQIVENEMLRRQEDSISKEERALYALEGEIRSLKKSPYYILGMRFVRIVEEIKRLNFVKLWTSYRNIKRYSLFLERFTDVKPIKEGFEVPLAAYQGSERITVYSCITGGYDEPREPMVKYENCSYVLFSDTLEEGTINGWEVCRIPEKLRGLKPADANRYLKLRPWEFFDSRYTIYVDGNVKIIAGTLSFINQISHKTGLGIFRHRSRKCLYREAEACLFIGKGNPDRLKQQVAQYEAEEMPRNYGLLEASMIVSDLQNPLSRRLLAQWHEEHEKRGSGRDQISLPYVIWKNGLTTEDIGILGENIDEDLRVRRVSHNKR